MILSKCIHCIQPDDGNADPGKENRIRLIVQAIIPMRYLEIKRSMPTNINDSLEHDSLK